MNSFFSRVGQGFGYTKESVHLVWHHKQLLTYYLLPMFFTFVAAVPAALQKDQPHPLPQPVLALLSIAGVFFTIACGVAATRHIQKIMAGAPTTIKENLYFGIDKWRSIIAWSVTNVGFLMLCGLLIGGSVFVLLLGTPQPAATPVNLDDPAAVEQMPSLISMLFGGSLMLICTLLRTLWAMATYLIIPVITFESVGIVTMIKHAARTVYKSIPQILGYIPYLILVTIASAVAIGVGILLTITMPLLIIPLCIIGIPALFFCALMLITIDTTFRAMVYVRHSGNQFQEMLPEPPPFRVI